MVFNWQKMSFDQGGLIVAEVNQGLYQGQSSRYGK